MEVPKQASYQIYTFGDHPVSTLLLRTLCRGLHQLDEDGKHGLGSLSAVPLHVAELGGDEVVKVLRPDHLERHAAAQGRVHGLQGDGLELAVEPLAFARVLSKSNHT